MSRDEAVLILVENLSVPFDRRVWQESLALRDAGYEVAIICPNGPGEDRCDYEVMSDIHVFRYELAPATGGPRGYAREYASALWRMTRLVQKAARRWRFTVIHACNPPDVLLLTAVLQRLRGAALVFDHHDLVPELYASRFGRASGLVYESTKLGEQLAFKLADVVIVTNESYKRVAIGRGGRDPSDVYVVRSAPDTRVFRSVRPDFSLKGGKQHLIAYLGVMGPQDGIDHALVALSLLKQRRDDWRAIFVGHGDLYEDMRRLRSELQLDDVVEFPGRLPNDALLTVLSSATIGLAPDPRTPLNDLSTMNKIVEYMALGLPVVSYNLREARVSAGAAGLYASNDDPKSFADAIDTLLSDSQMRERMARAGLERVRGQLSWEHSEKNLLVAYRHAETIAEARRLGGGRLLATGRALPEVAAAAYGLSQAQPIAAAALSALWRLDRPNPGRISR